MASSSTVIYFRIFKIIQRQYQVDIEVVLFTSRPQDSQCGFLKNAVYNRSVITSVTIRGANCSLVCTPLLSVMCNAVLMRPDVTRYGQRNTITSSSTSKKHCAHRCNVNIKQFYESLTRAWSKEISFFVKLSFLPSGVLRIGLRTDSKSEPVYVCFDMPICIDAKQ